MELIKVLIVEDDVNIAEINRRFVEKVAGFEVIGIATTGEQAKDWLEVLHPQLVLLDVYLPDIKGTDLVKYIRQTHEEVDVIMITAANESDIVRGALHGGVFDFIVKPLLFDRFKESLEKYQKHLLSFKKNRNFNQQEITNLWSKGNIDEADKWEGISSMPKGIDQLTLEKIQDYLFTIDKNGVTAELVSRSVGVSRSTARRYLEFLVSEKRIYAELIYGSVGRPERRYFLA